jgi:hypothetical protein
LFARAPNAAAARTGVGGFATVVAAVHNATAQQVAVKIMRLPAGNALHHPARARARSARATHNAVQLSLALPFSHTPPRRTHAPPPLRVPTAPSHTPR